MKRNKIVCLDSKRKEKEDKRPESIQPTKIPTPPTYEELKLLASDQILAREFFRKYRV